MARSAGRAKSTTVTPKSDDWCEETPPEAFSGHATTAEENAVAGVLLTLIENVAKLKVLYEEATPAERRAFGSRYRGFLSAVQQLPKAPPTQEPVGFRNRRK